MGFIRVRARCGEVGCNAVREVEPDAPIAVRLTRIVLLTRPRLGAPIWILNGERHRLVHGESCGEPRNDRVHWEASRIQMRVERRLGGHGATIP